MISLGRASGLNLEILCRKSSKSMGVPDLTIRKFCQCNLCFYFIPYINITHRKYFSNQKLISGRAWRSNFSWIDIFCPIFWKIALITFVIMHSFNQVHSIMIHYFYNVHKFHENQKISWGRASWNEIQTFSKLMIVRDLSINFFFHVT